MQGGAETQLKCGEIWEHAVGTINVAVTLRVALDDSQQAVVTAAAHGIAALLGAGSGEDAAWWAADSLPLTGTESIPP